jgi:hypothetical protein
MYSVGTGDRPRPPSHGRAESWVQGAIIIQAIFALLFLAAVAAISVIGSNLTSLGYPPGTATYLEEVGIAGFLLGVVLTLLGYQFVYRRVRTAEYGRATTWALLIGVFGLFTSFIPGLVWLYTWLKVRDAAHDQARMSTTPRGVAAYSLPAPVVRSGTTLPGPWTLEIPPPPPPPPAPTTAATCPRCRQPATWVPQYGRFYCFQCGEYV